MRHDPELVAETRAWFVKAKTDIDAGSLDLTGEPHLAADAAFHAQQAVEKVLKGFLVWNEKPFRKTHNLVELGETCAGIDPSLGPLLQRAAPLTEYVWRYRYPGDEEAPSREEAGEALDLAREVLGAVLSRVPEDVRP